MKDFVALQRSNRFDPPVRSLLDIDFYKFTMGNLIWQKYRDVEVTFSLIVRDSAIPIADIIPETMLRKCLDYARTDAKLGPTNMAYLRGMRVYGANMFAEGYTEFLEQFRLPPYSLKKINGGYELTFTGCWVEVSLWETIALAIISELYYRVLMERIPDKELEIVYARAKDRIYSKLEKLKRYPGIHFADFGQRRRHSFLWQKWVVGLCKEVMEEQFTGTSNTWMAFHYDLTPIGTNAHELPMVLTALAETDEDKRQAPYQVLSDWETLYGTGLRIFLPDTYTTKEFLKGAPVRLATEWRGMRQDSGDPIAAANLYIDWLEYCRDMKLVDPEKSDPRKKVVIFSDGLDVDRMIALHEHFKGRINTAFGWGTLLTNDFSGCHTGDALFRPFSMVCKVTKANGKPVVKLSDNVSKATGPREEIETYLRIFGNPDRIAQDVMV